MVSRDDPQRPYLGSMGIYLFKTKLLIDMLESKSFDDFGGQVIPYAIDNHNVFGMTSRLLGRYWDDPLFL